MANTALPISSAAAGHIGPASEGELAPALAFFVPGATGDRAVSHLATLTETLGNTSGDAAE